VEGCGDVGTWGGCAHLAHLLRREAQVPHSVVSVWRRRVEGEELFAERGDGRVGMSVVGASDSAFVFLRPTANCQKTATDLSQSALSVIVHPMKVRYEVDLISSIDSNFQEP
jgi:hypothetical protein